MDAKFGFTRETATFVFSIVAHVERTISGTVCANLFLDIVKNPTKIKSKLFQMCKSIEANILEMCVIFDK